MQLPDRVGKRLVVNGHGRLLYPHALTLLEWALEIEQSLHNDNRAIRVYASSTIGNYVMPEIIVRYRHDFPELSVKLSVDNNLGVISTVVDLRVGFGLVEGPCHAADIVAGLWLEDELVMSTMPGSLLLAGGVALQQLAEAPWILRGHESGTRGIIGYILLSHLPAFCMGMELDNSEVIKHAVRHDLDISCLSRQVIAEQLVSDMLAELKVPLPRLTCVLWQIHHRQKYTSEASQRLLQYCQV